MNVNRPAGFRPVRSFGGGTPQRSGGYEIASGLGSDIYHGDPVVLTGTNRNIDIAVAGNDNLVIGVFAGVQYVDANGDVQFRRRWATGTVTTGKPDEGPVAFVYDDPNQEFIIQMNTATGFVAADVGSQANFVIAAGNNFTGQSATQLDQTSISAAAGRQCRLLGLARELENDYGEFADVRVSFRTHQLLSAVGF